MKNFFFIIYFTCLTASFALAQDATISESWYNSPWAWWSLGGIVFVLLLLAFIRTNKRRKSD